MSVVVVVVVVAVVVAVPLADALVSDFCWQAVKLIKQKPATAAAMICFRMIIFPFYTVRRQETSILS